jgi:hypothetical protein
MHHAGPLLTLALLLACGPAPDDSAPPDDPGTPALVLSAGYLDFGELLLGEDSSTQVLTMSNAGDATVHIFQVVLEDPDQPFQAVDIGSPMLAPGEQTTLELAFEPLALGEFGTFLEVQSDDPHSPSRVILEGVGLGAELTVNGDSVDLGTVDLGCSATGTIELTNSGSAELTISQVTLEGETEDFALQVDELPATLAPGEGLSAAIDYAPTTEGSDAATINIVSDDPLSPERSLWVSGSALASEWVTTTYEVPLDGAFDLVIALDKSGGMTAEIAKLEAALPAFFDALKAAGGDFQVTLTQADDGCINGSDVWIDSSFTTEEATNTFTTMINTGGSAASNTERAFMLLEAALAEVGLGGCNEGLVREAARLHLMGISDEPEQSVNSWSYYLGLFQAYDKDVTIHAIGGDYPKGCDGAATYSGMYEATEATGGQLFSSCEDDWSANLELLASTYLDARRTFPLESKPVESSITVSVDGVSTDAWSFIAEHNTVVLSEDVDVLGGEEVRIRYAEAVACEQGSDE